MEVGYLLDRGHTNFQQLTWIAGAPEFRGTGNVKYEDKPRIQTDTWRCKSCGYLESYALLKKDT
jgi:hypothetical protein